MVEWRAATSIGEDKAAPELKGKAGARADGEPTGVTEAEKAAAAHAAAGAGKALAAASLAAPVATAAGGAETEAPVGGGAGNVSQEDVLLFAIEKGVPKDAAVRLSADLQACAAQAAADDEDEDALECTVMKRGNYWPYFWSQRLLVVERRSLLYFATPLPAGGAAPRGFFPLQPNTRLLFSFDRVSLYGCTEGLLLGIFNAPVSAAASARPWSPGASTSSSTVAPLFLSPALWASNQGAHAIYRPLHLPRQQRQRQQRGEVATSGEHRKGDVGPVASHQCATPQGAAGAHTPMYARPVPTSSRSIPLSLLLVPFRFLFAWFSSSTDDSDQSTFREAPANAHAVPDVTGATATSSRSLPSSKTTSGTSMTCSVSSSALRSSYTPSDPLSSVSSPCALSSSTPILVPPPSVCSASPSYPSAPAFSSAAAPANGVLLSPFLSSANTSLESASGRVPPPTCDVVKKDTRKRNAHQSLAADSEFWDAEDDPTHGVTFTSAVASSAAAPPFPASRSSCAPSPKEGTLSAGSFFSLPSTSSFPLLPCFPSPSHAFPPIAAHSGSSECCSSVALRRGSPSGFPPLRRFLSSNATLSPSFSASHSHSSISSPSSFSCLTPGVPFPASASAGTASSPPSTFASSSVPSSAAAPAPASSRACATSVPGTPSSSASLMSSVFHTCSSLASPAADLFKITSNERSESMRRWMAAKHEQTEHQLPKEQRKLQREQLKLQHSHDQLQQPIQRRHQGLDQWQHQMENLPEELHTPSGAWTPLECWSIGPAAVAGEAGRFCQSAQTVNLSKDARARPREFTPCIDSDSNRRTQGSDTDARERVASEAAVLLACSQETFAKEFNRASNPKFLFEFVDQAQHRRVSCAIAHAILRIRRQAQRKQQQQKQQLQERLNQGLLKWQQEPSASQRRRLLEPVEPQQHLPGGAEEQLDQVASIQNQEMRNCPRWQHFQRLLGPQHLQTAVLTTQSTSSRERSGSERAPVQGLSPSKREALSAGLVGGSLSSASAQGDARGDGATVVWSDARAEEGLDLPRLLTESAEADVLTGVPSATTGESTPGSNACIAAGTALGRSVGAKMNHVITSRQGRSRIENGRAGPRRRRNASLATERQWNVCVSESSVRHCIRKFTYLDDPTTNVATANRSHSDENGSRRAQRCLTAEDGVTEEALSAKAASATAGERVCEAVAHPPLSDGDAGSASRCFPRHSPAAVPSQHRPGGYDWEFRSRKSPKGSSYSELHAGENLTQIVSELLEILSPSEGSCSIDRPDDHFALGRGFHALELEDGAVKHRSPRNVNPLQVEKRVTGEQLSERGQGTQMCETKTEKHHFRTASEPNLLTGHQQRGETNAQEKERYFRLVRALTRLSELVSRDQADQLQQGRRRPSLRPHSLDCCKSDSEIGTLPAGVKGCLRRQHTAFTALSQEASQALFEASQDSTLEKRKPTHDPRIRVSARTSSPRRVAELRTTSARSDARVESKAADEKGEVTGVGGPLLDQTLTNSSASSREAERQQVGPLEQMQHEIPARRSAQLLQHPECITSPRVQQQENGSSSSPDQQRVRAASLLLMEQREQLERLKSVVAFLMRERELQLRHGYHFNEAELQHQWEEEQRRFEAKKRQMPLSAAHLLQGELNEWPEKYLIVDDAQKEVASCREDQLWHLPDEREAAVELLHLRGLGMSEASPEGHGQALPSEHRSRPLHEGSEQSQVPGRCSPVQKVAVERRDGLSKREAERQKGAPGAPEVNSMPPAGAGVLGGGFLETSQVDGNFFAEKNSCAEKGGTNAIATLSLEETLSLDDREPRVIDSDTQDQKSQRCKYPVTPVESRIIFRISTPPSSSRESDAGEIATEHTISREQSASRFKHQSSY